MSGSCWPTGGAGGRHFACVAARHILCAQSHRYWLLALHRRRLRKRARLMCGNLASSRNHAAAYFPLSLLLLFSFSQRILFHECERIPVELGTSHEPGERTQRGLPALVEAQRSEETRHFGLVDARAAGEASSGNVPLDTDARTRCRARCRARRQQCQAAQHATPWATL